MEVIHFRTNCNFSGLFLQRKKILCVFSCILRCFDCFFFSLIFANHKADFDFFAQKTIKNREEEEYQIKTWFHLTCDGCIVMVLCKLLGLLTSLLFKKKQQKNKKNFFICILFYPWVL